jgi:pyruvate dehydrogenase E1 component alpha subunit
MPGVVVDGNDVTAVYEAVWTARQRALAGEGPTLIECKTYRHRGHSTFDKNSYRPQTEIDAWLKRDPIPAFEGRLRLQGLLDEEQVAEIAARVKRRMDEAEAFARQSPEPEPASVVTRIFSSSEVK